MRSRYRLVPALLLSVALAIGAVSCAKGLNGRDDDPADREQQAARFTRMIDERRYGDVIHLIESDPEGRVAHAGLLAMAYLGRAGFEPLRFAEGIIAEQKESSADLERLVPDCDRRALKKFDEIPTRCLLKRIWTNLPAVDWVDFARAQALFRAAHGDVAATPADLNTLIAIVEAASTLDRVRAVVQTLQEVRDAEDLSDEQVKNLMDHARGIEGDAGHTLERARYSVPLLSRLLTGLDRQALLVRGADRALAWGEESGVPALQRLAAEAEERTPDETREAARAALAAMGF